LFEDALLDIAPDFTHTSDRGPYSDEKFIAGALLEKIPFAISDVSTSISLLELP